VMEKMQKYNIYDIHIIYIAQKSSLKSDTVGPCVLFDRQSKHLKISGEY